MKNICVICDSEKEYARGFMEFVNQRKTLPFNGVACTSVESLYAYAKEHPIDILLVAESFMEEGIGNIPAVATIILNEGIGLEGCRPYAQVNKYQACEDLLRDVMRIYSTTEHAAMEFGSLKKDKTEIIGVYNPASSLRGTTFAISICSMLCESMKVLYIPLTHFMGLESILRVETDLGLSDLLYFAEREDADINARISGMVYERLGFDMIPELSSPDDLYGIPPEKYLALFEQIAKKSVYDALVIDLGIPSFKILDYCTSIYVPEGLEQWSIFCTDEFLNALSKSRYWETRGRVIRVGYEFPEDFEQMGNLRIEKLKHAKKAAYARNAADGTGNTLF